MALGLLAAALWAENPVVIRDTAIIADQGIWPLLVGERISLCAGDTVYRERWKEIRDGKVFFQSGPFAYMPTSALSLSVIDSILVPLPLHKGGACLLVPVACVGGGILSFVPLFLILEYINYPEYPNPEATERLNFLV